MEGCAYMWYIGSGKGGVSYWDFFLIVNDCDRLDRWGLSRYSDITKRFQKQQDYNIRIS